MDFSGHCFALHILYGWALPSLNTHSHENSALVMIRVSCVQFLLATELVIITKENCLRPHNEPGGFCGLY